ncbi:hypothetical protein GR255_24790, partial [Mycobacterium tuberculosis]|nr:hypothetical protein [Mycobacterium tuberculosis]
MKPPNYRAVLNEYDAIERNTSAVKEVAAYFSDNKIKICDAVIFKRPTFRAMTNGYGTLYQMKDSDEAVKRRSTALKTHSFDADLVVIPTKISLLDATQVVRTVRYFTIKAGRLKMKPPNYRAVLNEYDAIERNTSAVKEVAA